MTLPTIDHIKITILNYSPINGPSWLLIRVFTILKDRIFLAVKRSYAVKTFIQLLVTVFIKIKVLTIFGNHDDGV